MLALVNPLAGGGRGEARWERIESTLLRRHPGLRVVWGEPAGFASHIERALAEGECWFLAAGGDGTVNLVASELVRHNCAGTLGAIGLGSSNDYHKPVAQRLHGLPARLRFAEAEPRDVCRLELTDERGDTRTLPFLLNAAIGTTAEANWRFNNPGPVLARLKQAWPEAAIMAAALHGIVRSRTLRARLTIDGQSGAAEFRNLGLVKTPHFAGSLRYDSPFEPRSRSMHLHAIGPVGVGRLLRILAALAAGRFTGLRHTATRPASRVRVESDEPFAVECDGEVSRAVAAEFSIMPSRLWCAA